MAGNMLGKSFAVTMVLLLVPAAVHALRDLLDANTDAAAAFPTEAIVGAAAAAAAPSNAAAVAAAPAGRGDVGGSGPVQAAAAAKSYSIVLVPMKPAVGSSPTACPEACAAADSNHVAVRGGSSFNGDEAHMCAVKTAGRILYGTGSFSSSRNKYGCHFRPGPKAKVSTSAFAGIFCAGTTGCGGGGLEQEVGCEERLWTSRTCDPGVCSKGCLCRRADKQNDYDMMLFFGYSDPNKPNLCITPAGAQSVSGNGFSSECRQSK